ncbi:glycosyltransferase family 4 protein [Nesterenkonia alkaliphila]|uniref:Glycosyltransferase n=1 Tax=Nesterenkonia alkaliphila TaxID=1463631 RepID=A0A7K1ULH8_9MICC|nr:glycosyltransferase family 4 protein [Nesterenkonia alkaliphila]MVT27345.1 glycosyltransferase [Nesterenkonia alkaliphila]GFZ80691.1 glycosyl transferase [Nesterenkonia alkaliphila]
MSIATHVPENTSPIHGEIRPLRIGMIAPPWFELPPKGYGGTEAVVAALTDQLVLRGHQVVLLSAGRNGTQAQQHISVFERPPSEMLGADPMPEVIAAAQTAQALRDLDLDIVHDHSLAGPLLAAGRQMPTVTTMHGPVTGLNGEYFRRLGAAVDIIAISDAQRRLAPDLNWIGTVHNAVDVASFPYREDKEDFLLWIGRFSPDKGAHLAIDAARAAGRRIVLAGKLSEAPEQKYFDEQVRARLGADAEYVGEADAVLKRELFSQASALMFPIQWEEPFGMVMVEAMACGTPVIATCRGSVPEVVAEGISGIVVDRVDQLPGAVARACALDPRTIRAWAEQRFDLPVMAEGYERIYRVLVEGTQNIQDLASRAL